MDDDVYLLRQQMRLALAVLEEENKLMGMDIKEVLERLTDLEDWRNAQMYRLPAPEEDACELDESIVQAELPKTKKGSFKWLSRMLWRL